MSDEGTYRQELWFTTRFVRVPPPPILRQDYILIEARNPEILCLPPSSPGWRARPRGRERVAYVGKDASFASTHTCTLSPPLKSIPPPPSLKSHIPSNNRYCKNRPDGFPASDGKSSAASLVTCLRWAASVSATDLSRRTLATQVSSKCRRSESTKLE